MARYYELHPDNPEPRAIAQTVALLADGAVIAYPTDSGFALGTMMENRDGADRIRAIRHLDEKHHFTLLCSEFAQLGTLVQLDNREFRAIKAATPGPYTFILPATKEVPRRLAHPKKKTVGVRIPDHKVALALVRAVGQPLLTSSLILPGETEPLEEAWVVNDRIGPELDVILDAPAGLGPTTVVDYTEGDAVIDRIGVGDPELFR